MSNSRVWLAAAAALSVLAACAGAPSLTQSRADTEDTLAALDAEGFTNAPAGDNMPTDRETARDLAEARQRLAKETSLAALDTGAANAPTPSEPPLVGVSPNGGQMQTPDDKNFVCKRQKVAGGGVTSYCWKRGHNPNINTMHVSANARTGVSSISRTVHVAGKRPTTGQQLNLSQFASGAPFDENMRAQAKQSFTLYFDVGASKITDEAMDILHDAAMLVQKGDVSLIRIEGHTDLSGTEKANLVLSLKRSKNADKGLVDILEGRAPPRSLQGYGARKPVIAGKAGLNSIKNRRVEIILF